MASNQVRAITGVLGRNPDDYWRSWHRVRARSLADVTALLAITGFPSRMSRSPFDKAWWRSLEVVEFATLAWVDWTAMRLLMGILYPLRPNRIAVLDARSAPKKYW